MKKIEILKEIYNTIMRFILYIYLIISGICIIFLYIAINNSELFSQLLEALPK